MAGDPDRLQQVFELLIRNSIELAADGDTRIEIDAELDDLEWLISIKGNGALPENAGSDRLFRPLGQGNRRTMHGSGFAMATCRAIVERHGGRIWAESNGPAGCAFRFTLPRLAEAR